ncbi:hypothetical protein T07_2598 [Trichinella nelsoni]|uniref:Uncharacterized protein n=1 Tax=Trichinella nelsoni TaxID=6336 RepID=A0A0V0SCB2_9BILA|nr:hypothetical protein T07_2598 [Trichinella nelsoni]
MIVNASQSPEKMMSLKYHQQPLLLRTGLIKPCAGAFRLKKKREAIEEAVGSLLYIRYNRLSRSLFVRNRLSSINCRFFSPKASIEELCEVTPVGYALTALTKNTVSFVGSSCVIRQRF